MKRPDVDKPKTGGDGSPMHDEWFSKKYPTIVMYLTDGKYDDGAARELSALSVSVADGDVLIALNDKDLKQSVYTQSSTLQDALKLMEGALKDGTCQWRPWRAGKRK